MLWIKQASKVRRIRKKEKLNKQKTVNCYNEITKNLQMWTPITPVDFNALLKITFSSCAVYTSGWEPLD